LAKIQNAGDAYFGIAHNSTQEIELEELKSIALIFSHIVDAKSTYTEKHSDGVADLSRFLE
jgi:HD-GYP domain-containing protein (c-di-GMP phosphodiesterase class II)